MQFKKMLMFHSLYSLPEFSILLFTIQYLNTD